MSTQSGEQNIQAKLSEGDVIEIRYLRSLHPGEKLQQTHPHSVKALAKRFGVTPQTIVACSMTGPNRTWRHLDADEKEA